MDGIPVVAETCLAERLSRQPVGVTPKSQVLQAVEDVFPPATLYWFPSQTFPTLPLAAGSGLAPE
jgi:hypothetical protein